MSKLSYADIKTCLEFRTNFSLMYSTYSRVFANTPYAKLYEALPGFEYAITKGLLDDPYGQEYHQGRHAIAQVLSAISEILNSNYVLSPEYSRIQSNMMAVRTILATATAPKKFGFR